MATCSSKGSTQVVILGFVFLVFMVSIVTCLKCYSCSANAPIQSKVWSYLLTINEDYAIQGYQTQLFTCMMGNHTNVTHVDCPPKPGYHARCAIQRGLLYFSVASNNIPFSSFSRHCEYIPILNPPSNSCIHGLEASQYTQAKPYRRRSTPTDIPQDYGIKVTFDGSVCFCDNNFCNDDDLYYPSSSTRLCWSLQIFIYAMVIRTLLIGL
ncbi:uncharacterized protein [Amphiura filiformis]|uniref:uncharacterized protein isoform X1 n=1 Tax=Amphiura filiformis TaxID=82378 RepID=UPI003B218E2B